MKRMKVNPRHLNIAGAVLAAGAVAVAAVAAGPGERQTPKNWSYTLDKDGKRVPRAERKVNEDGSWTEEIRRGNCVTTRTGRDGEVRETTKCD
jgi:hypothetical protein